MCGPPHGRAVLPCVVLRRVALRSVVLCCIVLRCGVCSGGVWPPACWGLLRWCVAPLLVGRAALGCSVLCCVALCVVMVCGHPYGGACCDGLWPPSWWVCVALCCVVSRCAAVCCVVLCCVVLCVVVVYGPPHGGACCVGIWPPSWWGWLRWGAVCCVMWPAVWRGVLHWCVPPHIVGRVVVLCGPPHGQAAVCCVVLCCLCWWCVAPRMLGRAALVCGPPLGGACCVGVRCVVLCGLVCFGSVWPPVWWGVLRWCVTPSCRGVLWWCAAHLMVGRALLACVGRLFLVVVLLLLGRNWRADLPSACGAPPLCPGRDGRAGLPSACGAPPRVVVSPVSSPCSSFSLVSLSCVCAVFGRPLAGVLFCPPPPLGLCLAAVVVAPLFFLSLCACWFPLWAACGRLLPPVAPPAPRSGSGFVVACLLLLVFACSVLSLLSPGGFGYLPLPTPLMVCVARVLLPRCSFFLVRSRMARRVGLVSIFPC